MDKVLVAFDIEIYRNYFLVAFKSFNTGKVKYWERFGDEEVNFDGLFSLLMSPKYTFVSFNGNGFDMILLAALANGASNEKLKEIADYIILSSEPAYKVYKQYNLQQPKGIDHIDIMQIPKGKCGLKLYATRINSKSVIELPYKPHSELARWQADNVREYCANDLQVTIDLYNVVQSQIELRTKMSERYGIDLRSKSDAQIAEAVISDNLKQLGVTIVRDHKPCSSVTYVAPKYIKFVSPELNQLLSDIQAQPIVRKRTGNTYKFVPPDCLMMDKILKNGNVSKNRINRAIDFGSVKVSLSLGGLHSLETNLSLENNDYRIIDRDVDSFYPAMILNNNWFPSHLGSAFIDVFRNIVDTRLKAKRNKDTVTNQTLKIVVNGTFGKLGSQFSAMYSQDLMFQTTITGQLSLLMLIERLTLNGHKVVSANTDGVVTLVKDYDNFLEVVKWWEAATSLTTEETEYQSYFGRDVNSYIAVKCNYDVKRKGIFSETSLDKNPLHQVVFDALANYVTWGILPEVTIRQCRNINDFIVATKANSGCRDQDGEYVGKVVRFYYAVGSATTLHNLANGSTVPRTTNCKLAQTLPDSFPDDVDYDRYIQLAYGFVKGDAYAGIED